MPLPSRVPDAAVKVFYLHGFASSAQSSKAAFFRERLNARQVAVITPDFNQPDFTSLTMTRMLDQLGRELSAANDGSIALIGSSLGGTLAILAAARFGARIDRLVLMAPAVMFAKPGHHLLPPERIDEWRRNGDLRGRRYAYGDERPLGFAFYRDSLDYDAF